MQLVFETERLLIRQPTLADADYFYALNSDPDIVRYIRPPHNREQADAWLKEKLANNEKLTNGLGTWAVEKKQNMGEFIGMFTLFCLPNNADVHLGYSLLKPFWGLGYATELTKAGIAYGFYKIGLPRIIATIVREHIVSQNILVKAGFHFFETKHENDTTIDVYEINKQA
jgi:[ribosomal protein S5]-alanine N-acetyltransferase